MEENKERLFEKIKFLLALKHSRDDNEPSELLEYLYIGSIGAALNKNGLRELGITHILTVADSMHPPFPELFEYKTVELLDQAETDILSKFDECFEFIEACRYSGGKILVHWYFLFSFAGKSRSGTICIAYVMRTLEISLLEAFEYVRERRTVVMPNTGFMNQLKTYEQLVFPNEILKKGLFRKFGELRGSGIYMESL